MTNRPQTTEDLIRELEELREQNRHWLKFLDKTKEELGELRESAAKYEAVVYAFGGLIYICSTEFEIEFMNEAFIERSGRNAVGEKCYKVLHDRESPCPWCVNERVFSGETVKWEVLSPKDKRWYSVVDTPVRNPDGTVSKMGVIQDITDQKTAMEAVRQSEERYRALFESSRDAISIATGDGRFLHANQSFLDLFGYDAEELMEMNAEELWVDPKSRYRWQEVMERDGFVRDYAWRARRKDGVIRECLLTSTLRRAEDGSLLSQTICRDVTEAKIAEETIRRSEERYRSLIEQAPVGILSIDGNGQIIEVNKTLLEVIGSPSAEITKSINVLTFPPLVEAGISSLFRSCMEEGRVVRAELPYTSTWGKRLEFRAILTPMKDSGGTTYRCQAVIEDITQRKRLEAQLQAAARIEAIGRLAGGVAHDFNNLMTAILGYSNMLALQLPQQGRSYKNVLQITRAAESAAALTRQLLAFSRRQVLDVKAVDLNELLEDLEGLLKPLIGEDINIATVLDPTLGTAQADPSQIEQIVMNLVVNARDAMPHGGRLTIETANVTLDDDYARTHAEVEAGPYVVFSVSDTGIGMDAATQARIFDPFFTTKEKGVGTGLGLSTVYGIVKQHRGHISVYCELGLGSTFKVYLPRIDRALQKDAPQGAEAEPSGGTETILIVEDEELVRNLASEVLEMLGYRALAVGDPLEALELCERNSRNIDLLVTDVVLPQMSGKTLAAKLQTMRRGLKVLFVSGYAENAIVQHGVLNPGVNFLQKPFTMHSFARKVRAILDSN